MTTTTTPEAVAETKGPRAWSGLGSGMRQYGIMGALVLIVLLFQIMTGGRLLQPNNVTSLVQQNAYVLILAVAKALREAGAEEVLVAGQIKELGEGGADAVDGNVFDGMDVVELLTNTLNKLGA